MRRPSPEKVASLYLDRQDQKVVATITEKRVERVAKAFLSGRVKTAGEVRFVKDRSGDEGQWAYADNPPEGREITPDYAFNPRNVKPLAKTLRSVSASLGHLMSAYTVFVKLKSADVSPDGRLGGKGYIQTVGSMRKKFMNTVEALSALSDTLYDEVRAPHWAAVSRQQDPEDRREVEQILEHTEQIRKNPEDWADSEIEQDEKERVEE